MEGKSNKTTNLENSRRMFCVNFGQFSQMQKNAKTELETLSRNDILDLILLYTNK